MKSQVATIGARVVDSYPFSMYGGATANDLKEDGVDCLVGYLGVINPTRLLQVMDAGLAFMPVTLAGHMHGESSVNYCHELCIPQGVTVWLDLEGQTAFETPPLELIGKINAWADAIQNAGYMPGLYVGVPQPLTSDELYSLKVVRYWRGQGSIRDRHNQLAEPTGCGWCMTQAYPQHNRAGVLVDDDMIQEDYKSRLPVWCIE